MGGRLYELLWDITTDVGSFSHREWKVFRSDAEAKRYGKKRERELNDGHSIEAQAEEGYYYRYFSAREVEEVDGYRVSIEPA